MRQRVGKNKVVAPLFSLKKFGSIHDPLKIYAYICSSCSALECTYTSLRKEKDRGKKKKKKPWIIHACQ